MGRIDTVRFFLSKLGSERRRKETDALSCWGTVFLLIAQPASASGEKLTFPPDHKLRNAEPEGRRHFDVGKFLTEEMGEGAEVVGLTWFVVEAEK